MTTRATHADLRFRRPTEADHPVIVGLVDEWWGGRRIHDLLPRLWFQHFTGTSWLAETEAGRLAGFLIGFVSPDDPTIAYIHMIGIDPNRRRQGLAGSLYARFFEDAGQHGATRVRAITWPGNRVSVAFHRSLGFRPADGPGSQNLYGTPAYADYDAPGEDRVMFERPVGAVGDQA
jgi:ribosomal protein S18 acetylase RimI-like enzyme